MKRLRRMRAAKLVFAAVGALVLAGVAYAAIQDLNLEDDTSLLYDPAASGDTPRALPHRDLVLHSTPATGSTPAAGNEPKRQTP